MKVYLIYSQVIIWFWRLITYNENIYRPIDISINCCWKNGNFFVAWWIHQKHRWREQPRTSNPMGLLNNQRTECTDRQLQCIRLNVINICFQYRIVFVKSYWCYQIRNKSINDIYCLYKLWVICWVTFLIKHDVWFDH